MSHIKLEYVYELGKQLPLKNHWIFEMKHLQSWLDSERVHSYNSVLRIKKLRNSSTNFALQSTTLSTDVTSLTLSPKEQDGDLIETASFDFSQVGIWLPVCIEFSKDIR